MRKVIGKLSRAIDIARFLRFLRLIDQQTPAGPDSISSLDNSATHKDSGR